MWDRPAMSKFIQLYKSQPVLYEIHNTNYRNKKKRDEALQEITSGMQKERPETTVSDIKRKINIMRTQYLAERAKMKKIESYEPALYFFKDLSFLDPYISDGRRLSVNGSSQEESDPDYLGYSIETITDEDGFVYAHVNANTSGVVDTLETTSSGSLHDIATASQEVSISAPGLSSTNNGSPSRLKKNMSMLHRGKRKKEGFPEHNFFSKLSTVLKQDKETESLDTEGIWGKLMANKLREIKNKKIKRNAMREVGEYLDSLLDKEEDES